ncbi:MAG: leucine dehydrogenase [Defluviitaleaceae bacterium]|nr:leucine dehydrogenase [Defluviitaleaceae bacterium]MCL2273496.1 leucine dehydrogenase [Defluviitaleaceae bacterium]
MEKFKYMEEYGYEQLCFFQDKNTGLKAIVCVHNTVLGPALGGTRVWNYANEEEAAEDVLRLARGMTYKSALAGLALGGGKAVIMGDPNEIRKDPTIREAFWRSFGRYVNGLSGRYITAEDVGTSTQDMVYVNMETNHVVGLPGRSGDPSPFTALGVFKSIQACCRHVYGDNSVEGKTIAVQGAGNVGYYLCQLLHEAGAKIFISDVVDERVKRVVEEFKATPVDKDAIYSTFADIYAPCALGATINDDTIPQLKCKIVCGGANNVLKNPLVHGRALQERGITYAPDYLANAGGVINVSYEHAEGGYNEEAARRDIDRIYNRMREVLRISDETGALAFQTADKLAEGRIEAMRNVRAILSPRR